jgi:hypothetical protein
MADSVVEMYKNMAHTDDDLPVNIVMRRACIFGKRSRGLPNYLDEMLER